jgi:hypothetical protein
VHNVMYAETNDTGIDTAPIRQNRFTVFGMNGSEGEIGLHCR